MKKFSELRDQMSPEAQAKSAEKKRELIAGLPLDELRSARSLTQQQLASILGVNQAAISKMERRTDMYISTLRNLIVAMGGTLEIYANFPDGRVVIDQFADKEMPKQSDEAA